MRRSELLKTFKRKHFSDLAWIFVTLMTVGVIVFGGVVAGEVYTLQTWPASGTFSGPMAVAVDPSAPDKVYIADTLNDRIVKYNSWGTFQLEWGTTSELGIDPPPAGTFFGPSGVAIDSLGNVYVADGGNDRIQKFSSSGVYSLQWGTYSGLGIDPPPAGTFYQPSGVAIDTLGNVYVGDYLNHRVQKFNSAGVYGLQWGTLSGGPVDPAPGTFFGPFGVAVDTSGNVYVADSGNDRIQKFNSSGGYQLQWGTSTAGVDPPPAGTFVGPFGVAVDTAGNVYVADSGNNRIQKFDENGNYLSTLGSEATPAFSGPNGIALDGAGNIYVADTGNNLVQKFSQQEVITVKTGVTNGSVSCPSAPQAYGSSTSCTITPDTGFYTSDLQVGYTVNSLTSTTVVSSYPFPSISTDWAIYAVFTPYPILLVSGALPADPSTFQKTLSDAYAAASGINKDTMKMQNVPTPMSGPPELTKPLIMAGGYNYGDPNFTTRAAGAVTAISGQIVIGAGGQLTADRIAIH